jgi:hypothetical protein
MTDERFRTKLPGAPILIKENPATYLFADADRAVSVARDARAHEDVEAEASASRAAVFLYFAALEGFINFVYCYSEVESTDWEKWPTVKKWLRAPEMCLPGHGTIHHEDGTVLHRRGDPVSPLDDGSDLIARFCELRDVRNAMVHVQPEFALVAEEAVDPHVDRSEYLLLTGLPRRLVNFRAGHAETAATIAHTIVQRLDVCLHGQVAHLVEAVALYEFCVAPDPDDPDDDDAG